MGDYDFLDGAPRSRAVVSRPPSAAADKQQPHTTSNATNGPATKPPSYSSLQFDPNGTGEWYAEIRHPIDAVAAGLLANEAINLTNKIYVGDTGQAHNDEADAFRHAYWSMRMAQAFGAPAAKSFTDGHEISDPNPVNERLMDLYNNQVGRDLASTGNGMSATDAVKDAIKKGILRTKPF